MAQDVGMDALTLRALAARGPDAADLLPGRLAGLGLDADQIGYHEPGVLRDLERVCSFCGQKQRCARDLGGGATGLLPERRYAAGAPRRARRGLGSLTSHSAALHMPPPLILRPNRHPRSSRMLVQ